MSPKRGDRVSVPAPDNEWEISLVYASPRHPKDTDR